MRLIKQNLDEKNTKKKKLLNNIYQWMKWKKILGNIGKSKPEICKKYNTSCSNSIYSKNARLI